MGVTGLGCAAWKSCGALSFAAGHETDNGRQPDLTEVVSPMAVSGECFFCHPARTHSDGSLVIAACATALLLRNLVGAIAASRRPQGRITPCVLICLRLQYPSRGDRKSTRLNSSH